ncbi:hypothetical protein FOVG_14385 [Fusarium oxysporum f. sp. pisi HDV247]|uniref:Uncharacterized protein n=1 Tax=Fusarium oxysporum f. sp. pisi HDV247 TaxID=1080344 RepID=W9P353_FUSOX|nr:hypothetical protein FOVG_14385 [Fusarium oxysporum f. sp. pisi HDV247]KAJ4061337.1 hypothetical protein NW763_004720 [Fusarium oxysporum]
MGRECSFTGTAKSALDSVTNNKSLDIDLDDNEGVAQGQDSYYRQEQEEQGNSETSPPSTTVRATNGAPLAHVDLSQGTTASSTISADGSRPHDFGPELNDEIPSTLQPELSLRSMDTSAGSSGTDEVV